MKLIHTSDWHIGRSLYGRKRHEEFEAFLDWLAGYIETEAVDALLVAGDVFDTSTPGNRAQELYYRFLCRVASSGCQHVIVTAGNHDSPSFIEAPREVLRFLNVHVVGSASDCPADHVKVLANAAGLPQLIVCAVSYLRDRDIRKAEAGESVQDKERKLVEGIRSYYGRVGEAAEQVRSGLDRPVPIVAMGHLFTAGGRTVDGDGVRELYVGSLALGLSSIASRNVRIESLFLDEGFGTLDDEALETALETLAELQQDSKLIGVILHVPALRERIATQIQVVPGPGGRSCITGPVSHLYDILSHAREHRSPVGRFVRMLKTILFHLFDHFFDRPPNFFGDTVYNPLRSIGGCFVICFV